MAYDDGGYETLIGTVDDKYLVINRFEPQESGSMITKEIIDQNGKTVSMEEPYSSEEYDYHDDHFRIKIEREGDSAAATVWIVDSGEKRPYLISRTPKMHQDRIWWAVITINSS